MRKIDISKENNFDKRRKSNIPKEELKKIYYEKKLSIADISNYFTCSKNAISYWLRKYSLKLRTSSESMALFNNKSKIKIDKDELYTLFILNKLTLFQIAKIYNCEIHTIIRRLREYNITNKFSNGKKFTLTKRDLESLYLKKKLTTYTIAAKYGYCQGTIWKKLKQYNIKTRTPHELNSNVPSKEILYNLYINKKLSTWEIEKKYDYGRGTVYRKLKEYGIKIRSRAESHIIYPRKNFNGNLTEKAYLIGFRIGDLRARKIWENSETINVDCGSTKPKQIKLIKKLFESYTSVWISKPNNKNKRQIEVKLNLSFSFLLNKNVDSWILENKNYFFSFLAGFSDAEGSFYISKRKSACYGLGNYDSKLLFLIKDTLNSYGINTIGPYECNTSKYIGKDGYGHNQNYWTLSITKKSELLNFIQTIQPYLKHEDKIKALNRCRNNIIQRNNRFNKV